jgi:UDP-N-acetylglucosamine:LPS N-acetylglucosamine transferase
MKICLACSAGGHLTEALKIGENISGEKFYATFYSPHLEETLEGKECYMVIDPRRNPLRFLVNFLQVFSLLLKKRPDVIISTGAGVTFSFCLLGKLMGAKIVYVECGCRVTEPSLAARMIYPLSDLFIVRWKPLLKYFKRARLGDIS